VTKSFLDKIRAFLALCISIFTPIPTVLGDNMRCIIGDFYEVI
jgi:hypothetical protein